MKKKSQLVLGNSKGFLQVDFLFVILFFFTFFLFIYSIHVSYLDGITEQEKQLKLQITSKDICDLLISQGGIPDTWINEIDANNKLTPGLLNETSKTLDEEKINFLFDEENYADLVGTLEIEGVLYIEMNYAQNGSLINSTGLPSTTNSMKSSSTCFSKTNDEQVFFYVGVWR